MRSSGRTFANASIEEEIIKEESIKDKVESDDDDEYVMVSRRQGPTRSQSRPVVLESDEERSVTIEGNPLSNG